VWYAGRVVLRLLERSTLALADRMTLLAPLATEIPPHFKGAVVDDTRHAGLIRELQTLRGSIYLADGAVRAQDLSPGGLHETPEDDRSWHLLIRNPQNRVTSCAWYLEHDRPASIESLRVRNCPLNGDHPGRDWFRTAIHRELARAREEGLRYAEVGGWAVAPESRCTSEALILALSAYSLCSRLGGALCLTTATVRHASSVILRRLGGCHLDVDGTTVPTYYDEKYRCDMELLRFDSRRPSPRYGGLVDLIREQLSKVQVVGSQTVAGISRPGFAA
jgi:hypothetical protein